MDVGWISAVCGVCFVGGEVWPNSTAYFECLENACMSRRTASHAAIAVRTYARLSAIRSFTTLCFAGPLSYDARLFAWTLSYRLCTFLAGESDLSLPSCSPSHTRRAVLSYISPFTLSCCFRAACASTRCPACMCRTSPTSPVSQFRSKPGPLSRSLPWVSPYHRRLDWCLWIAALGHRRHSAWFPRLLLKLVDNDREVNRIFPPRDSRLVLEPDLEAWNDSACRTASCHHLGVLFVSS